jgi:hypothetical protein
VASFPLGPRRYLQEGCPLASTMRHRCPMTTRTWW